MSDEDLKIEKFDDEYHWEQEDELEKITLHGDDYTISKYLARLKDAPNELRQNFDGLKAGGDSISYIAYFLGGAAGADMLTDVKYGMALKLELCIQHQNIKK